MGCMGRSRGTKHTISAQIIHEIIQFTKAKKLLTGRGVSEKVSAFFHIFGTYWFIKKIQRFFKEYKLFAYVYQLIQNFLTGSYFKFT